MQLKVLVTGCGRSGSCYMAKALTQLGLPCGHECLFDWRGYDGLFERIRGKRPITNSPISLEGGAWVDTKDIVAESSYAAAPFLKSQICVGAKLIHIVRHPLKVITSFVRDFKYFMQEIPNERSRDLNWQQFIYRHLPELSKIAHPIERAAFYYVNWNRMVESLCLSEYHRIHIEKPFDNDFFGFLEVSPQDVTVPKNTNSKAKTQNYFPLDAIPHGSVKDDLLSYAEYLGYQLKPTHLL